jgi:hypothetical protein
MATYSRQDPHRSRGWTAATDLPDGLSDLFVNHPSIGLAILVNAAHHPVRRRFSSQGWFGAIEAGSGQAA